MIALNSNRSKYEDIPYEKVIIKNSQWAFSEYSVKK